MQSNNVDENTNDSFRSPCLLVSFSFFFSVQLATREDKMDRAADTVRQILMMMEITDAKTRRQKESIG